MMKLSNVFGDVSCKDFFIYVEVLEILLLLLVLFVLYIIEELW